MKYLSEISIDNTSAQANQAFVWKISWQYFGFGNKVEYIFKKKIISWSARSADQNISQSRSADQVKSVGDIKSVIYIKSAHLDKIRSKD